MNKYWIHKPSGNKAIVIDESPTSVKLVFEKNVDYSERVVSKSCIKEFYIPVTKAEYESSLTLKEIERSRNKHSKYKIGDIYFCKKEHVPCMSSGHVYEIIGLDNLISIRDVNSYNKEACLSYKEFEKRVVKVDRENSHYYFSSKYKVKGTLYMTASGNIYLIDEQNHSYYIPDEKIKNDLTLLPTNNNGFKDTFESICQDMIATHKAKNHDYGDSFHNLFKELGMNYAYGHLREKLERVKTLKDNETKVKGESMIDSLKDLANYAIMTIIELQDENF